MQKIKVRYATGSRFKQEEIGKINSFRLIDDGHSDPITVGGRFEFEFPSVETDEPLERDLERMVKHKVRSAYRQILAPCVVEHAGLNSGTIRDPKLPRGFNSGNVGRDRGRWVCQ